MNDLWQRAVHDLEEGNFTALQTALGGPSEFDRQIIEWFETGKFEGYAEMLEEAFTCACMLDQTETVSYLLDKGIDPLAGKKTGLNGFHYAACGRLAVIKLLIEHKVPMEVRNMYGGTVLEQALWSAVNEFNTPDHGAIIEALINAGAEIGPGTYEWWNKQPVPSAETKRRVGEALRKGAGK